MKCATWFGAASASRSSTIVPSAGLEHRLLVLQLGRRAASRRRTDPSAPRRARPRRARTRRRGPAAQAGRGRQRQQAASRAAAGSCAHYGAGIIGKSSCYSASRERALTSGPAATAPQTYEEFYGFAQPPFTLAPDPQFLYLSESHDEASGSCCDAIRAQRGLHRPDRRHRHRQDHLAPRAARPAGPDLVRVARPQPVPVGRRAAARDPARLRRRVARRRPQRPRRRRPRAHDLTQHAARLPAVAAADRRHGVLIIDEAQHLSAEVLEQIRVISTVETNATPAAAGRPGRSAGAARRRWRRSRPAPARLARVGAGDAQAAVARRRRRLRRASPVGRAQHDGGLRSTPGRMDAVHALSRGVPRLDQPAVRPGADGRRAAQRAHAIDAGDRSARPGEALAMSAPEPRRCAAAAGGRGIGALLDRRGARVAARRRRDCASAAAAAGDAAAAAAARRRRRRRPSRDPSRARCRIRADVPPAPPPDRRPCLPSFWPQLLPERLGADLGRAASLPAARARSCCRARCAARPAASDSSRAARRRARPPRPRPSPRSAARRDAGSREKWHAAGGRSTSSKVCSHGARRRPRAAARACPGVSMSSPPPGIGTSSRCVVVWRPFESPARTLARLLHVGADQPVDDGALADAGRPQQRARPAGRRRRRAACSMPSPLRGLTTCTGSVAGHRRHVRQHGPARRRCRSGLVSSTTGAAPLSRASSR